MDQALSKKADENESQYIWRIGQAKDSGLLNFTWEQLSPILNTQLGIDETEWRGESAWRKKYRVMQQAWDDVFSKEQYKETRVAEIDEQINELFRIKKQVQDQRRELRNLLTPDARFDNLTEKLIESANHLCDIKPLTFEDYVIDTSDREAVIAWADWHYGMVTDNIWNQYNTDICRQRVADFVSKAIKYIQLHKVKTLHIMLLGDVAHGAIHTGCRVASEEDVCDQLMQSSEIMAEAINELSSYVPVVNVYATYGGLSKDCKITLG